jgi:hypothetical protein
MDQVSTHPSIRSSIVIIIEFLIDYFLFNSSDLFLSSSLLAGSPRLSAITGPGLALWCSKVAASPLLSVSWRE